MRFIAENEKVNLKELIARSFLEAGCVNLDAAAPFTLASGMQSPLYIDGRRLLSHPAPRAIVMKHAAQYIKEHIKCDMLAGGESAGIPITAFLCAHLNAPMIYVRKNPKGHGLKKYVEGHLEPNKQVLLIEDHVTKGTSQKMFIPHLRAEGAIVKDSFALLAYDIEKAQKALTPELNITLHILSDVTTILALAAKNQKFKEKDILAAQKFIEKIKI